jgi:hypothetical protein
MRKQLSMSELQDLPPGSRHLAIVSIKAYSARISFSLFGVFATGLDTFPHPVHPVSKHRLQGHFGMLSRLLRTDSESSSASTSEGWARNPLTDLKRSQIERYQVNMEDATPFVSDYPQ